MSVFVGVFSFVFSFGMIGLWLFEKWELRRERLRFDREMKEWEQRNEAIYNQIGRLDA